MNHEDEEHRKDKFISEYTFQEKTSYELQDGTIVLVFAELGRFSKTESECVDDLDRMCYLLKHMGQFDQQPVSLQQDVNTRIFEDCGISGYDDVKLKQFQEDVYDERRLNSELKTARRIGCAEGVAQERLREKRGEEQKDEQKEGPKDELTEELNENTKDWLRLQLSCQPAACQRRWSLR